MFGRRKNQKINLMECFRTHNTYSILKLLDNPYQILDITYIFDRKNNRNNDTVFICACNKRLSQVAIKMIDKFGEKCLPEHNNIEHKTAFMYTCINGLSDVAIKMIDRFGDRCLPEYYDMQCNTAFIYACHNQLSDVAIKMIDTFGEKCLPEHHNLTESTAFICACDKELSEVVIKMIDIFGEKCLPDYINSCYNVTAFMSACNRGLVDVALKMIDTFGEKCLPEYIHNNFNGFIFRDRNEGYLTIEILFNDVFMSHIYSNNIFYGTSLMLACNRKLPEVAIKMIDIFGNKCLPFYINNEGESAMSMAIEKRLYDVIDRLNEYKQNELVGIGDKPPEYVE